MPRSASSDSTKAAASRAERPSLINVLEPIQGATFSVTSVGRGLCRFNGPTGRGDCVDAPRQSRDRPARQPWALSRSGSPSSTASPGSCPLDRSAPSRVDIQRNTMTSSSSRDVEIGAASPSTAVTRTPARTQGPTGGFGGFGGLEGFGGACGVGFASGPARHKPRWRARASVSAAT